MEPFRSMNAVMLHPGRCGSTVLGDMIGQHQGVWWDSEVFEIERQRRAAAGLNDDIDAPMALLRSRMRLAGRALYGFELKFIRAEQLRFIHMDLPSCLARLEALGFSRFVVLTRQNLLRRLVSAQVGLTTQQWHTRGVSPTTPVRVRIETGRQPFPMEGGSLVENFDVMMAEFAELRGLLRGRPVLELSYEQHVESDPYLGYRSLAEFLALKPQEVVVRYRRTNPFGLSDLIDNYDEVAAALAGSPYEWMLEARPMPLSDGTLQRGGV